jgi:redox-sensing transcriptional repressor
VALFDNDTSKIGERTRSGVEVFDVKQIAKVVEDKSIDVAVIAVPARIAQKVLNQVMAAGVKAILNFAPAPLTSRLGVKVKTVDLTTSLESLSYFLAQPNAAHVTKAASETSEAAATRSRRTREL